MSDGNVALCPTIDKPGIYDISADAYHADPVIEPSLSSSIAHVLLSSSPSHAWQEHPRLNPAFEAEDEPKFDLGTAAHGLILQGDSGVTVIEADDWRTKAAREARDAARAAGKTPLLAKHWDDVEQMADAVERQLDAFRDPPRPLSDGLPERTLVWREGSIWCRVRLDWLYPMACRNGRWSGARGRFGAASGSTGCAMI